LATEEGINLGAWTTSADCGSVFLGGAGDHLCFGIGRVTAGKQTVGFVAMMPMDNPMATDPSVAPMSAIGNFECSGDLIRGFDAAGRMWSYDVRQGREVEVTLPAGIPFAGNLFEQYLFVTRGGATGAGEFLDGWVWTSVDGAKPLVQPTTGFVYDLRTDGNHLVWMIGNGENALDYNPADVWVAPLAFAAQELASRRIGSIPSTMPGDQIGVTGAGYYAVTDGNLAPNSQTARELHLFDLSDGSHWRAPKPEGTEPGKPLYVDGEEVWYKAQRDQVLATIIRQRIVNLIAAE
jgi:hypothetical protein